MRSYVQNGDQLHESCGVFTGPKITVLSPAQKTSYSGPLSILVRASSPLGSSETSLKQASRSSTPHASDPITVPRAQATVPSATGTM